jgi:Skp family chaperone for outer membrane proteins
MMEEKGINVRHMHLIYEAAELPYIREHLFAEALARTIKKEFRSALAELENMQRDMQREFLKLKSNERHETIRLKREEGQRQYQ